MAAYDKVRIAVLGDSGVGKTSLVYLIAHGTPLPRPQWTIGCSVEVQLHSYQAGTPAERKFFVELYDVGGSSSHRNSRSIFYNLCNGVILVHDLTNRKSQQNLFRWLEEILNKDENKTKSYLGYDAVDAELLADCRLPVLVIGTKSDLVNNESIPSLSPIAEECGADEIHVDSRSARCLQPGSSSAVKLARFFDKVIQKRYFCRDSPGRQAHLTPDSTKQTFARRTNFGTPSEKLFHFD